MLPVHWAVCPRTGFLSHAEPGNGYVPGQGFCPLLCLAMAMSQDRDSIPCCAWQWLCPRTGILSHAVLGNGYQCPGTGILFQDSFCSMPRLATAISQDRDSVPCHAWQWPSMLMSLGYQACVALGQTLHVWEGLTWVALLHPTVSNNGNQNQCPAPWIKKPVITWTMDSLSWMVVLSPLVSSTSDTLDSMSVSQARQASNDWR